MKVRHVVAAAIVAGSMVVTGTAMAVTQTVSGSVGPIPVPNVPVQVCANNTCQQTPALSSVLLNVTATADNSGTLPTITPGLCPPGQVGGVLTVNGGSSSTTVGGTVSGTLPNGSSFSQAIPPLTVAPGGSGTVGACATPPSPGPLPVPVPSPTGLLGLLLNLIQHLIGGGLPI